MRYQTHVCGKALFDRHKHGRSHTSTSRTGVEHRLAAFWCSDAPTIVEVVEGIRTRVDVMSRGNLHAQNNEGDAGERWEDKARVREEQEESFTGEERIRG